MTALLETRRDLPTSATPRELLILSMLRGGAKQHEVAAKLNISQQAVSKAIVRASAREQARIRMVEEYLDARR